jgi:cytochrome oxidase assembly protein ShyY1
LYVVALTDSSARHAAVRDRPARLDVPAFTDEGPHLNYAVQWFSFAAIALIGTPLVVMRQRRRRE